MKIKLNQNSKTLSIDMANGGNNCKKNNIMIFKNAFKIFFGSFKYKLRPFQNIYHGHQN